MASAHRSTFTRAIPADAVVRVVNGVRSACWTDRKGQKVVAPIMDTGKCQRTAPGRW
jgi:hypothetical protein